MENVRNWSGNGGWLAMVESFRRYRRYEGISKTKTGGLLQEIEVLDRAATRRISHEDKHILRRIKRQLQDKLMRQDD